LPLRTLQTVFLPQGQMLAKILANYDLLQKH
jgi:hypothetical protein